MMPSAPNTTDQSMLIAGNGFKMVMDGDKTFQILNDEGQPVTDINERMTMHRTLVMPFLKNMTASLQQEIDTLSNEAKQIGYVTQASEALPHAVFLLGETSDLHSKKTFHYAARIGHGTWEENNKAVTALNDEGAFTPVFGKAALPSHVGAPNSELRLLYQNKESLGLSADDDYICGEEFNANAARLVSIRNGCLTVENKDTPATVYAMWHLDHLVF